MTKLFYVGLGGCLGALARYGLSTWANTRGAGFPLGTVAVNVTGCFAMGLVLGWSEARGTTYGGLHFFLLVGFLGSFTTFSTFGADVLALLRAGETRQLALYASANLALGLAALEVGRRVLIR